MTEAYIFWAMLVGIAIGGAVVWFAIGRLPRRTDDVSPEERVIEAAWISSVLAERGRRTLEATVEEVLELHAHYLAGAPPDLRPEERDAIRAERLRSEEARVPAVRAGGRQARADAGRAQPAEADAAQGARTHERTGSRRKSSRRG